MNVTDLRPGHIYKENNRLYKVIEYKHQKLARGSAKMALKIKDIRNGAVIRKTYQSGTEVEKIQLNSRKVQYLYSKEDKIVTLDLKTYEQFEVDKSLIEDKITFLKDSIEITLNLYNEEVVDCEIPLKIEYNVKESPPDVRGNTAQGGAKEVILENGLKVKAPMFIKKNDRIVVDTRNNNYIERV